MITGGGKRPRISNRAEAGKDAHAVTEGCTVVVSNRDTHIGEVGSRHIVQSIANWTSFLQSEAARQKSAAKDPADADRACDRLRAGPRAKEVKNILRGVSFARAKSGLLLHCLALMQKVSTSEQSQLTQAISVLEKGRCNRAHPSHWRSRHVRTVIALHRRRDHGPHRALHRVGQVAGAERLANGGIASIGPGT
jgi:hypothetical protein